MIDKDIMDIFKDLCEKNNEIIKKERNSFMPICVIVEKNNKITILGMIFTTPEEKEKMKKHVLSLIVNKSIRCYILIMDAKMTMADCITGKSEVFDVSIRQIYTPKEKHIEIAKYKDGKISDVISPKDDWNFKSEWDLWGAHFDKENPEDKKILEDYKKFKRDNPDKYRGLV